jgi:hypothetical protein
MMTVMAGKRLVSAGVLAAAVTAAAAFWVSPHAPSRAARHLKPAVTAVTEQVRATVAQSMPRSPLRAPAGLLAPSGTLVALVLIAVCRPRRVHAVPSPVRPPRRGRAPPSPVAHHPARPRDH